MSGLEPLIALSLTCNILQLISFGHETISLVKRVCEDGTFDQALNTHATRLNTLALNVPRPPPGSKGYEKGLFDTAQDCQSISRDLEKELKILSSHASRPRAAAAIKIVLKSWPRKKKIYALEGRLKSMEQLMQSGLLMRIL